MNKSVRITFSEEAKNTLIYIQSKSFNKKEKMLYNAINNKLELVKIDIHYGNPIAQNLIPMEYKQKYHVDALFRIELPMFWRMLYTLKNNNEIEIIAFVLDIIDHKKYNNKFNYK